MFQNAAAEFVYMRTYSRWIDEEKRRETWPETVARYIKFIKEQRPNVPAKVLRKIQAQMLNFGVLPSMRLLWAAGPAAARDNTCIYNCSYLDITDLDCFGEALFILMCGTGVGFGVTKVEQLPDVPVFDPLTMRYLPITITDSKEGWADSVKLLLHTLYSGNSVDFDYSQIRPRGSRLNVFGGRASGPEPLVKLHAYIKDTVGQAQGRKLTALEVHDIMCEIAEIVVVGGVRRSSLISLSKLDDTEMRASKVWPFPIRRAMANNSAVYESKPTAVEFLREWQALIESGSGERGIFNLYAAKSRIPKRRQANQVVGVNPCGEVLLRSRQYCNLSTVIVRPEDDIDSLLDKVETAAWMGTIQASFTHFPYLRPEWKQNCEEEALLGVSLSGQMDNTQLLDRVVLQAAKNKAIKVNARAAEILGINPAAAITCGKPEGTTSQFTVSGSGCHPWYSEFFIRRYRINSSDPLYRMMCDQGFKFSPENGQTEENATTWVVSFPCKAPTNAITRHDMDAMEQLHWYQHIQDNWCEHNQSITVYVKDDEWLKVGNWVYENWDTVNGVSFLPYDNGKYQQAPYEEITEEQYEAMKASIPTIDYTQLSNYEIDDNTEGAKSYACVGDRCELK